VRPRPAQVGEDVGVGAPALFEGVRQDGEALRFKGVGGKDAVVVGRLSQGENGAIRLLLEGDRTEGVANDVPKDSRLPSPFRVWVESPVCCRVSCGPLPAVSPRRLPAAVSGPKLKEPSILLLRSGDLAHH
jgi:hypothetical protein